MELACSNMIIGGCHISHQTTVINKCSSSPYPGVAIFRVDPRFRPTPVGWNLESTRESPTPTYPLTTNSHVIFMFCAMAVMQNMEITWRSSRCIYALRINLSENVLECLLTHYKVPQVTSCGSPIFHIPTIIYTNWLQAPTFLAY